LKRYRQNEKPDKLESGVLIYGISLKGAAISSTNYLEEEKIRDFDAYLPISRLILMKKISKYSQQVQFKP